MKLSLKILSLFLALTMISCGGKEEGKEEKKDSAASAEGFEGLLAGAYNSMENPMMVLTMDIDKLQDKSDLKNTLAKQMGPNPQAEEAIDQFKGMIKKIHIIASMQEFDPTMESDPKGNAIILAKVEDKDKFEMAMGMAGAMMPDVDEINGFKLKDLGGQAVLGYSDGAIILTADADGKAMDMMKAALEGGNTEMNELLANSVGTSSDISMYMNMGNFMSMYSEVMKKMENNPAMEGFDPAMIEKYMDIYKEASTVVEINFENGKLTTTLHNDLVEKAGDAFDLLGDAGVSADIMGKVANNPIAMFSLNFKWDKMWEMVKPFMNEDQMAKLNSDLEKTGLKFDELMGLFNGKLAFAYNGQMADGATPKIGFYVGLTDPSKIEAILPADKVTKDDAGIYSADGANMMFGDDFMLINTDKEFIAAVAGGTMGEVDLGDQANIMNSPVNYFVDFKALMANEMVKSAISAGAPEAVEILGMLDKAYGHGTANKFEYVLETNDKSSNILVQMIDMITKAMNAKNQEMAMDMEAIEKEF